MHVSVSLIAGELNDNLADHLHDSNKGNILGGNDFSWFDAAVDHPLPSSSYQKGIQELILTDGRLRTMLSYIDSHRKSQVFNHGISDPMSGFDAEQPSCFAAAFRLHFAEPQAACETLGLNRNDKGANDGMCKLPIALLNCDLELAGLKPIKCESHMNCKKCLENLTRDQQTSLNADGFLVAVLEMLKSLFNGTKSSSLSYGQRNNSGSPDIIFSIYSGWKQSSFLICNFLQEQNKASEMLKQQKRAHVFATKMETVLNETHTSAEDIFNHLERNNEAMNDFFNTLNTGLSKIMRGTTGVIQSYDESLTNLQREFWEKSMAKLNKMDDKYKERLETIIKSHSENYNKMSTMVFNLFEEIKQSVSDIDMLVKSSYESATDVKEMVNSIDKLTPIVSFIDQRLGSKEDILEAVNRLDTISQSVHRSIDTVDRLLRYSPEMIAGSKYSNMESFTVIGVIVYYLALYWLASIMIFSLKKATAIFSIIHGGIHFEKTVQVMYFELVLFFAAEILLYGANAGLNFAFSQLCIKNTVLLWFNTSFCSDSLSAYSQFQLMLYQKPLSSNIRFAFLYVLLLTYSIGVLVELSMSMAYNFKTMAHFMLSHSRRRWGIWPRRYKFGAINENGQLLVRNRMQIDHILKRKLDEDLDVIAEKRQKERLLVGISSVQD